MNCPSCGRFMKQGGYYSNDHYDSWTPTWRCGNRHEHQVGSAYSVLPMSSRDYSRD